MELSFFKEIVEQKKHEHPFWFDDEPDAKATAEALSIAEKQLGTVLPKKYKEFVLEYGGGYFAFTNVFSVDPNGTWNLSQKNEEAESYLPKEFLAVSDDEAGGLFGFLMSEGNCSEEIYYWDHDASAISDKMYDDVFEYIVSVGLTN